MRAGRDGTYRQAADGLIVRLAAAEERPAAGVGVRAGADRDAEAVQRELLALACRDAAGQ
ncbi:MAG: hypothetical protein ABI886_00745 [Betaproteobacteria bacterium]